MLNLLGCCESFIVLFLTFSTTTIYCFASQARQNELLARWWAFDFVKHKYLLLFSYFLLLMTFQSLSLSSDNDRRWEPRLSVGGRGRSFISLHLKLFATRLILYVFVVIFVKRQRTDEDATISCHQFCLCKYLPAAQLKNEISKKNKYNTIYTKYVHMYLKSLYTFKNKSCHKR